MHNINAIPTVFAAILTTITSVVVCAFGRVTRCCFPRYFGVSSSVRRVL